MILNGVDAQGNLVSEASINGIPIASVGRFRRRWRFKWTWKTTAWAVWVVTVALGVAHWISTLVG